MTRLGDIRNASDFAREPIPTEIPATPWRRSDRDFFSIHLSCRSARLPPVERRTAMAWTAKTGQEADRLMRIAARLFALADLAERAAGRSYPVRLFVLWCLSHADAVARDFIAGSLRIAGSSRPTDLIPAHHGSSPADAFYLATSLRSLGLILHAMAARLWRAFSWHRWGSSDEAGNSCLAGRGRTGRANRRGADPIVLRRDTS